MGEELFQQGYDERSKVKILRSMLPIYRQFLRPSKIVPYLAQLLDQDGLQRAQILDLERAGKRVDAVNMLMEIVMAKKEEGFNLFLFAVNDMQSIGADIFLMPQDTDRGSSTNNRFENEYFQFILLLLEGQIISMLTKGELQTVVRKLHQTNAIDEIDMEEIEEKLNREGRHYAAVQMFTSMRTHIEWPLKFIDALREVKPELLRKIDPSAEKTEAAACAGASYAAASSNNDMTENADGDEQTLRKEPLSRRGETLRQTGAAFEDQSEIRFVAVDDDDDDDSDGDFSDEEKYMAEESEKQQKSAKPQRYDEDVAVPPKEHHRPKEFTLRKYQMELAAPALEGRNTIICAPTGSGKTRVALHIVRQHLQVRDEGEERKVVFLARTGPLVAQQFKTFRKWLPEFPAVLVTGESEHSQNLHGLMPTYKILVLTPKILENHLTPDKIPSLEAFSLIIFDECHHTRKGEPYNSVMKSYLKSKKKGQRMPQIVGLTASIGVEKATTVEKAKDSILGVMGNLDVTKISTVKENVQELRDTVPRPEEMLVDLIPRDGDDISNKINNIMMKLEEQLTKSEARVDDKEIEEVRKILARRPGDRREQKYGQWAVALRNQVRLLKIPSTPADADDAKRIEKRRQFSHEIQILADSLVAYNEALDVHDLTRPQDVLDYLQQKFLFQRTYKPPEVDTITLEKRVLGYLTDLEKMLERDQSPNPNLDTLALTIMQHLMDKEGEESHIIIFVRTRATCQALCNWMNSRDVDEILRQLNAMPFTGSGAHQDQGGMTQNMQESVIEKFRSGEVKLIVSTSVGEEGIDIPECNLTIKYNHVGNEVTTVQTRGRSRKRGGQSVLLAMPRIIMQERVNRQREQYMIQAIQLISNMRERDISKRIVEVQKKTLEAEEIEEVVRKVKKLPRRKGNFSLACCQCYKVRVDGSQIRKIQDAHRVIVGNSLKDKVTVHTGSTTRCFDEMEFRGSVICRCKNRLGQLLIYKGVRFMTLGLKYWVVMDDRENPSTYKKWKDMPYAIEELSAEDIKEQLRTSGYDIDEDEEAADEDSDY